MFSLLCRSATLLQPITARRPSIYLPALLVDESLPLFASFLTILIDQFEFLDPEFFAAQMPGLDNFLLDELDHFCTALSDAALEWNQLGSEGGAGVEVWKIIVERYVKFANLTSEKFGWQLGMIKGSRATGYASQLATRSGEREHEVDIEDLEEGDDAPVIVDM
jgi:A1 cistron-splicing factor AAR2